jgi:formylglycine-generating enzyme required for sulfatase activity
MLGGGTLAEPHAEDLDGILVVQENPDVYAGAYQDATQPSGPRVVRYREPLPPREMLTNSIGMQLTLIPAGEFRMGSMDSWGGEPHPVRLTKPFYLGVCPVTQQQYEDVMGTNPSHFRGDRLRPVERVSWIDAVEFCNRLSDREGRGLYYRIDEQGVTIRGGDGYRLPTEAEWEYACRAGTTSEYSFGDDSALLPEYAWFDGNSGGQTQPIAAKKPNRWGLYDMHGNVWEWCQDWYDADYYRRSPVEDAPGPDSGSCRVLRGGSWYYQPEYCRSAACGGGLPGYRYDFIGFRAART